MAAIKNYLDENVPVVVAEHLNRRGIDAVTVRELGRLSNADRDHLTRATVMGRVLCTHDRDFLRLARQGIEHAGIVFGKQRHMTIGRWVRALISIHARLSAEDMASRVEFI